MDLSELKPIIDLMNTQEERLYKKIDKLHADVKIINNKVAEHEKSINSFKAIGKFIVSSIILAGTAIGAYFTINHK